LGGIYKCDAMRAYFLVLLLGGGGPVVAQMRLPA
jgi:hypothetical protein